MALNNNTRETLIASYTGENVTDSRTLDIGTTFMPGDDPSGGYENLTTVQDEIILIRQFDFTDITTVDHDARPITAEEAWEIWTLPNAASSGSLMYTVSSSGTVTFTAATGWKWNRKDLTGGGTTEHILPDIKDSDKIYILRKTPSAIKSINFNPGSRLTAASLNVATDQSFRLAQENYALWHNFGTLNPSVGTAGGVCPLNAKGLIDEKYVDDTLFLTAQGQDGTGSVWDAKNMKITNCGSPGVTPLDTGDVVNRGYLEGVNNLNNYYLRDHINSVVAGIDAALQIFMDNTASNLAAKADLVGDPGVLDTAQLPKIAIAEFLTETDGSTPDSEAEMIALKDSEGNDPQIGDWTIRSDNGRQYILGKAPSSVAANWIQLAAPTADVDSIITANGGTETGAVTINATKLDVYTKAETYSRAEVTGIASLTNFYNKTHIDANLYTQSEVNDNFYNKSTSDGRYVQSASFGNTEVTATGGTTSRDLDDHFADWVNVKDFGAVGDGEADDTTAIQAALDHLTNGVRGTVFFPYGRYKVTSTINVRENNHLDLNGSTIEFNVTSSDTLFITASGSIDFTHTYTGTNTAFKKGDLDFTDSGLGSDSDFLTLGMPTWASRSLRIWTDDIMWYKDDNTEAGGDTNRYLGEWNKLAYVDDAEFELANPLRYTYTDSTSSNVRLELINTTKNIQIRNGILKDVSSISANQGTTALTINRYNEDVIVDNVTFEGFTTYAVRIEASQNIKITNCTFKGIQDVFANWNIASYGVAVRNGCENVVVDNCTFDKIWVPFHGSMDSSISTSYSRGPNHGIRFTNNQSEFIKERSRYDADGGDATYAGKTDYVGHNFWYCDDYKVSDNTIVGGETFGIYGLGGNATITNNTIKHSGTEYPVGEEDNEPASAVIHYYNVTEHEEVGVIISNNIIDTTRTVRGIYVRSGQLSGSARGSGISNGVVVSNNIIRNILSPGSWGIVVIGYDTNGIHGVTVEGNSISKSHRGIAVHHASEVIVSSNRVVCNLIDGENGVDMTSGPRYGIETIHIINSQISNNNIIMNRYDATSKNFAIAVQGPTTSKNILITGNNISGYRSDTGENSGDRIYYLNTSDNVTVSNNVARDVVGIWHEATDSSYVKQRVRTFGNLYYPSGEPNTGVGGVSWGKEMDTGFTPQIEVQQTTGSNSYTRQRPTNSRISTWSVNYPGTFIFNSSNQQEDFVLNDFWSLHGLAGPAGAEFLHFSVTVLCTGGSGGSDEAPAGWAKVNHTIRSGYDPVNHNLAPDLKITFMTTDGSALNSLGLSNETIKIGIMAVVADSIDTDGALY
jgi:polygalacturonase